MVASRQSFSGRNAIHQSVEAARTFGETLALGDEDQAHLCILVEELVTNLFEHGGLSEENRIEIMFDRLDDAIRLVLLDRGTPFDPRTATDRPVPDRGGGTGLNLVQAWARSIDYQTTAEGNRLELVLPLRL